MGRDTRETIDANIATASGAVKIQIPALGDESGAAEVQATTVVQGFAATVYLDIAFVRRDLIQYTVIVAGLQSQQGALVSSARALDARISSALIALPSSVPVE